MAKGDPKYIVDKVRQSQPVDTSAPYNPDWVKGKTILITGGASGLGEGFFRKWASHGANVIIGDINDTRGKTLVEELRSSTSNQNHHFIHCDVIEWQSQVDFFHQAIKLSPTGGIDSVVANAGISDPFPPFDVPSGLDADTPPKPNLKCIEVNLLGLLYTAHLALFYLPKNPNSKPASPSSDPESHNPDRHLLLLGSVASLGAIPGQVLYGTSKHGVLGLFRSLRSSSFQTGVRVNMLCPYFIDTPIIPVVGRLLLAGGATGKVEDVVDAGTRFMADSRICGRALVVGPKVNVSDDGELKLVPKTDKSGKEVAVWEAYADDFEAVEAFSERFVNLMNAVETARGWGGWAIDVVAALTYPLRRTLGLK
jgi:NAD(P)-dependent dehydrogenase (short-subunit alcohol dehydrogenase family)